MSETASSIDISEIAEILEDRKSNSQQVAIILGSRAGPLFSSREFYDDLQPYSSRTFADMEERERFYACYSTLEYVYKRKMLTFKELKSFIEKQTNGNFNIERHLAELVKDNFFKVIITNNIDDLLYESFQSVGMRENVDFVDFSLGRLPCTDDIQRILSQNGIDVRRLIRVAGDIDTFIDNLNRPQERKAAGECVRNLLDQLRVREVLILGIDLAWDEPILSALPSHVETVWFVNEDEHVKDKFIEKCRNIKNFRYLTGPKGNYKRFFERLYRHINQIEDIKSNIDSMRIELIKEIKSFLLPREVTPEVTLDAPPSPKRRNATHRASKKKSNSRNSIGQKADILLVTVTDIEAQAILHCFPPSEKHIIDRHVYYDFGSIGPAHTVMARSTHKGPFAAIYCVDEGIDHFAPHTVIMVGVAYGLHPNEQQVGDILVAEQIINWDVQKIHTGPDKQPVILPRGSSMPVADRLLVYFQAHKLEWTPPPQIHFGQILSSSRLIDHEGTRDELLRYFPEAIGGEMEGHGLCDVCSRKKVDWILVKAICDWADGNKGENKDDYQRQAADNAAHFVFSVIKQYGFTS